MTLSEFEGHFCCLKFFVINKARFNYPYTYVYTWLQRAHGLWFKLHCQKWRSSQGHRQSRSLQTL